jgi:hypothetical protein
MLGIWLSEHPFTHAAPHLAQYVNVLCNEITPELLTDSPAQGRDFVMAGLVGSTRKLATRDGRTFIAAEIQDLSGAYEVTVWPDVYERTQDYWLPGSILLMQVRIRERGERLNAGVQDVVQFEEGFLPPVWATETAPSARRSPSRAQRDAPTPSPVVTPVQSSPMPEPNMEEPPFEPGPAFYQDEAPAMTEDFDPSEPPEPVTEVAVNEPAPRVSTIAPQPEQRPSLRLVLQEGDDEAEDQKRLSMVFRLLQERPGRDDVYLSIKTREGETVELKLPTAELDEGLRSRLEEAVGLSREALAV